MSVNYISLDRLGEFLNQLKQKLAANSASSFPVYYAATAVGDEDGSNIKSTYATKTSVETVDGRVTTLDGQVIKTINFTPSGASSPTALTPTSGAVAIDLSGYALKSEVASAMDYKGSATGTELAAKTVANTRSGDVYTCSADSGNFHAGLEYVAVVSGTAPSQTLTWEELGKWVDLSGYVQKKTSANGYIATFDSTGDVVSTGVLASILSNGSVVDDNGSFVTGGQVASAIETAIAGIDFPVDDVKVQVGSGTASSIVSGGIATLQIADAVTSSSAAPVTSGAVYTAINNLDYSKVVEEDGTTKIATLQEASASDVAALFA